MTPIYFPFTYIQETTARALSGLFRTVTIYQPTAVNVPDELKKLAANSVIAVQVPADQDDTHITSLCSEFLEWRGMNAAMDIALFRNMDRIEQDDSKDGLYNIKAAIKKKAGHDNPEGEPPSRDRISPLNSLFNARLFLQLAQNFDIQNLSVDKALKSVQDKENQLLQSLKGEKNGHRENLTTPLQMPDPGMHMTSERLEAWSRLFMADNTGAQSPLFITTSRSVRDHLIERYPNISQVVQLNINPQYTSRDRDAAPPWHQALWEYLEQLALEPNVLPPDILSASLADEHSAAAIRLTIYRMAASRYFPGMMNAEETTGKNNHRDDVIKTKETVFGLLELNV